MEGMMPELTQVHSASSHLRTGRTRAFSRFQGYPEKLSVDQSWLKARINLAGLDDLSFRPPSATPSVIFFGKEKRNCWRRRSLLSLSAGEFSCIITSASPTSWMRG